MGFMVDMVRDSAESGGRDRFSCTPEVWDLLLEVGKAFGWKPQGTSYVPSAAVSSEMTIRHGYRPGDRQDFKRFDAEDAAALARALSEAKRSPHLAAMLGERPGPAALGSEASVEELSSANAPFAVVMDEFIEYAFGGEFSFARSA